MYVAPQGEVKVKVREITEQTLTGPSGSMKIRRFDVTFNNPGGPLDGSISIDTRARFVRLELPSAGLTVVRDDASSVAVRCDDRRATRPTSTSRSLPTGSISSAR